MKNRIVTLYDDTKKLEEMYLSWLESIKIRKIVFEEAKRNLKDSEAKLKTSKKIFYRTQRELKEAKDNAKSWRLRWKSHPTRIRKYAKENMDKVFNLLEKDKIAKEMKNEY